MHISKSSLIIKNDLNECEGGIVMTKIMSVISWIVANYQKVIAALIGVLTAILTVLLIIPGSQGEEKIQSIISFLNSCLPLTPQ